MIKDLGIYIHIPFCASKCAYCDFYSFPADDETKRAYADALRRQTACAAKEISRDYRVVSVFFGGGTPSILDAGLLMGVLDEVRADFAMAEDCEITVECNPGTADSAKLRAYRQSGVNRLSLGLQSANDGELRRLGRIHSFGDFARSYEAARKCGFDNINVDLMSAIPGQTAESWLQTLRTAAALRPEHISAYSLIIEEGTPLGDIAAQGIERLELPDEETEREMYRMTEEYLGRAGYAHYEISNYARADRECRHNVIYWKRGAYLGFGAGASSFINEKRYTAARDISAYIANPENAFGEAECLTASDAMSEFMFLGLRMLRGVKHSDFRRCFGRQLDNVYGGIIDKYAASGHIIDDGESVRLSSAGIDVSNYILADFII
ncbi:MAG: radical SAM family heme chaperone HemW [Butyrivibrio sp.]|nr:radical SAM family heme chaperone HemW [Butyrivibrio sp.]